MLRPYPPSPALLTRAVVHVANRVAEDSRRSRSWRELPEHALWRELVTCILGSRVSFRVATASAQRLAEAELLTLTPPSWTHGRYERRLREVLATPPLRHPHAAERAQYISRSARAIYGEGLDLRSVLFDCKTPHHARRTLVATAMGIGPKQASLFLNCTGYTDKLAVFDTHSLTYMQWCGMMQSSTKGVARLHKYEELEKRFVAHANELGFSPADLDLAVWVVVRVAKELHAS